MRIGVDIMGGDYAPQETIAGSIEALNELGNSARIVLIGDSHLIYSELKRHNCPVEPFEIIHAPQTVTFNDSPTKALVQKPESGIAIGFRMLAEKKIDAFASAGNTGVMMVGAKFSVKTIPGIIRPTISSLIPKEKGGFGIILDVGINADCKPEMLQQFALVGSLYAEHILQIKNPKVGLMNIGEEEEKGDLLTHAAFALLRQTAEINFIGNVEGRDLFNDKADVIVCDGFTGNVILKQAESFYTLVKKRNINDPYFNRFDFENYGGTPLLGVNATVVVAHGISKSRAIKNMIKLSYEVAVAGLHQKIATALTTTVTNQV
ncbi:MAG: phosphate acyltransferase PlsX [Bacteroidia bacterium]|nr:phosphate acyltransferase PlsX [Bacteroidia bacterium]MCZ2278463.1 phosphate acyltransferase PlsX [Bacteroidia bacterium]